MGTLVNGTIPTDKFALTDTFDRLPDTTFESVGVVAHGSQGTMPYLWAFTSELTRLDDALRSDDTTDQILRLSRGNESALYRITWCPKIQKLIQVCVGNDGSLIEAKGTAEQWELRFLFPDQAAVSSAYKKWCNRGIDPTIHRVKDTTRLVDHGWVNVSKSQHRALLKAYQTDYYDIPREITLENLANQFGVSHQALSERLRRGHRNLIKATLCESSPPFKPTP
jgi:predicted DNA binding protein